MTQLEANPPTSPDAPQPAPQPAPRSRQQALAAAGLLVCLVVGLGIIYGMLFASGPKRRIVEVDPDQPMSRRGDRPGPPRGATAIQKGAGDTWTVRGHSGAMRVSKGADGKYQFTYQFAGGLDAPPEQVKLLTGANRVRRDEAMAKQWGITPEQQEKLRKLEPGVSAFKPDDAQRAAIAGAWDNYLAATKAAARADAANNVIARLDEAAKANLQTARQNIAKRAETIRSILTPEQVKQVQGQ